MPLFRQWSQAFRQHSPFSYFKRLLSPVGIKKCSLNFYKVPNVNHFVPEIKLFITEDIFFQQSLKMRCTIIQGDKNNSALSANGHYSSGNPLPFFGFFQFRKTADRFSQS